MRTIAMYLPQFHRVKENDEWWGEGFTEWTAVKAAEKIFEGHEQPRVPLNDYYYDLTNKNTMKWQAELAQKYGIDGFAFYHYWFKDGKKILEKPAENLLNWKDVDMPFCFCWANETWARTWSKLTDKNTWGDIYEDKKFTDEGEGILLSQKYGNKKEWIDHINYLIPFLSDSRYIKFHKRPVFILYKPDKIPCLSEMLDVWNGVLKEHNIEKLYVIGSVNDDAYIQHDGIDANLLRFPDYAFRKIKASVTEGGMRIYDYDEYIDILKNVKYKDVYKKNNYISVAVDFDNSPRRGNAGIALKHSSAKKFELALKDVYKNAMLNDHEFVFINAWNEWGEGMYLEPDKKNEYSFLESVFKAKNERYVYNSKSDNFNYINEYKFVLDRLRSKSCAMDMLSNWMSLREKKVNIASYLLKEGIHNVAIYGMGYIGRHLMYELKNTGVKVSYIIDRNISAVDENVKTYVLSENLEQVDAIIITPAGQYDRIKKDIKKYVNYNTISLEYILSEML